MGGRGRRGGRRGGREGSTNVHSPCLVASLALQHPRLLYSHEGDSLGETHHEYGNGRWHRGCGSRPIGCTPVSVWYVVREPIPCGSPLVHHFQSGLMPKMTAWTNSSSGPKSRWAHQNNLMQSVFLFSPSSTLTLPTPPSAPSTAVS